jgi:hypothetical protein
MRSPNHPPMAKAAALAGMCAGLALPLQAIELRNFDPARHNRFTGSFTQPGWNDSAWYQSRLYGGIGWAAEQGDPRQYALVSPTHVVGAAHYLPPLGSGIVFLSQDGSLVHRSVAMIELVKNSVGENTDLALITLSTPVQPSEGVAHFPYLNLATEDDYLGSSLVVFGHDRRAGRGSIASFNNYTGGGSGQTRVIYFNYRKTTGNQDDAYLVLGDSGSPTFVMAGQRPAVVGIHSAAQDSLINRINIDTFIPAYIPALNSMMVATGYRMTPAYTLPLELAADAVPSPAILWQASPGGARFDLENLSASDAGNVNFSLTFPSGEAPATVSAPGWISENNGPLLWKFRRASIPAGATASVTAAWATLPVATSLQFELEIQADGVPNRTESLQLELRPGYDAWSLGLPDGGRTADPDGDGLINVLEYAFGGDPVDGGSFAAGGQMARVMPLPGGVTVEFPVRADASQRGLSYEVEFSPNLAEASWETLTPGSLQVNDTPLSPDVGGFLLRRVMIQTTDPLGFYRIRVALNET